MSTATTIFLGICGGGTLITFIQFLISRHDGKTDKRDEILKEVKGVKKDVQDFKVETEKRFDKIDRKVDDQAAIQARARILRFHDEVQAGKKFTQEAWNQTFEDISTYNGHCEKYKNTDKPFLNSKADSSISNLIRVHAELLDRERQGESVFL